MATIIPLHKKLEESFSSVYLTLASIIQGAAFSILAVNVATQYARYSSVEWTLAGASLALIVLTWNEYMIGATAFIWIPWLGDAIIPFGLGAIEVFIIEAIGNDPSAWFLFTALYAAWSTAAFVNMYVKANGYKNGRNSSSPNRDLLVRLGWRRYASVILCVLLAAGFGALYVLSLQREDTPAGRQSLAAIGLVFLALFGIRSVIYWRTITEFAPEESQTVSAPDE